MGRERLLNALVWLSLLALPIWALIVDQPFTITLATKVAILAMAGVGLNIALGLGGLISFGHAIFFGIGGYVMGVLASHGQSYTSLIVWPFEIAGTQSMPVIWLLTIIKAGFAALAIGALCLRTSGVYFIMITLAFSQMFYYFTISWPAYGGEDGLSIYVRNQFPGLNTLEPIQFFAICLLWLTAALWLFAKIQRSSFGLALNAARQNAARVEAIGIEPYNVRLIAFIISGVITAISGALYADLNRFVSPTMFSWQTSGEIMIFVILGGVGRLFGPVVGAALFVTLEHVLGPLSEFWHIYLGLLLLIIVLFARGGLIGLVVGREALDQGQKP